MSESVLVLGGGVSGLTAALKLAELGIPVVLIEREAAVGGWTSLLCCKAADTCVECSVCLLSRILRQIAGHPLITVHTNAVLTGLHGEFGHFTAEIRRQRRGIDADRCIACGLCQDPCPVNPKAIRPTAGTSWPFSYIIDESRCLRRTGESCTLCVRACPTGAIDFDAPDETAAVSAAAVIVATGFEPYDAKQIERFGYGRYSRVFTAMDMEKLLNRGDDVDIFADGAEPLRFAFIQCVGSRSADHNYCSQVCCKYAMRFSLRIKHQLPASSVTIFYIDLQNAGKGFSRFYDECLGKIRFVRGVPFEILEAASGALDLVYEDIEAGAERRESFDWVILSVGMVPREDTWRVAEIVGLNLSQDGFFEAADPEEGVMTAKEGVFLAGACQGPKDISDSAAHGAAAAKRALEVLRRCRIPA